MKTTSLALLALSTLGLTACGGGDNGSDTPMISTATFNFGVSDAPVDNAAKVMLCFNAIELTGNGLGKQSYTIGSQSVAAAPNNECLNSQGQVVPFTRGVDLLALPGANQEQLVTGATVPAGNYGQLRLVVAEGSYIELLDGRKVSLTVPSNEIKMNNVTLSAGGTFNYTLEFDLRKAVVNNQGGQAYQLKPTGLRLVDNSMIGHIQGKVAESLLLDNNCTVNPADTDQPVAMMYFYQGTGLNLTDLSDYGGTGAKLPYASAPVKFDGATTYSYQLGFVDTGSYTVAITCNLTDNPEAADTIPMLLKKEVTVTASSTPVTLDF